MGLSARDRVQGFKGSRVQGFKGSRVQGFKGSRVQGFKGSRVQGFLVRAAAGVEVAWSRPATVHHNSTPDD
jgi:hypothetical protein